MTDTRDARQVLTSLALADHAGDVNNELPRLAELLGEPQPVWCDICESFVWPWQKGFDAEEGHVESYEAHDE